VFYQHSLSSSFNAQIEATLQDLTQRLGVLQQQDAELRVLDIPLSKDMQVSFYAHA
jgi:hypothetical protein